MDSSQDDVVREEVVSLWEQAVKDYERETKQLLLDGGIDTFRRITSPEELAEQIEAAGMSFTDFRSRRQLLWTTLCNFIAPIATLASIAVTPASVIDMGVASSAIAGAIVHLLRACEGVSSAYDWVEQIFKELKEFSERLAFYVETKMEPVLQRRVVAILAFTLRVIGHSERLIREHRFREYLKVIFLGKDVETQRLLQDLNKLFGSEQRVVVGITYHTVQKTEETTRDVKKSIDEVLEVVHETQNKQTIGKNKELVRQILHDTSAPDDVEETFARKSRALLKGTGAWLRQEQFFNAWETHEASVLWIFGGPGTGKTYLSTWIIKRLRENPDTRDVPVAYFFVNENKASLRDANIILKTLAWQITGQDQSFETHATKICCRKSLVSTAEDTWANLFLGYYASGESPADRRVMLIIDGLDEATLPSRRAILGLVKELVTSSSLHQAKIQFVVVGRKSLQGDMAFKRLEKPKFIELSRLKNKNDIENYIRKRLEDMEILHEMRKRKPDGLKRANKLGGSIMKKVSEGADGVFLWAKLLLDELIKKDRPEITATLAKPPPTLDCMIFYVFERLDKDDELDHDALRTLLLFITHARRPLLFGELNAAVSVPQGLSRYRLWNHARGKLSSVFDLKFPRNLDPDLQDMATETETEAVAGQNAIQSSDSHGSNMEDEAPFDFSTDDEDSGSDLFSDTEADDAFSTTTDFSASVARSGSSRKSEDIFAHLSSGQLDTEVAFCHTRIQDYMIREGIPEKKAYPVLSIIPATEDADLEISVLCIEMLQLSTRLKGYRRYLGDYSVSHLPIHLDKIDPARVPRNKLTQLLEGLYWLFGTEAGPTCLIKSVMEYDDWHSSHNVFWKLWVGRDQYLKLLQKWFALAESVKPITWSEKMVLWMASASENYEALLRPSITAASKIWLVKSGFDSYDYHDRGEFQVWLIHGWLSWVAIGKPPAEMDELRWRRNTHDFSTLSPERLESLANCANLEHDVHWHIGIGWILMAGHFYEPAITHFRQAIDLDGAAWVAMEGLGRCHGEQDECREAISWQEKAIGALPTGLASVAGYLWPRVAEWADMIDDKDKAYEAAWKGYRSEPYSVMAQFELLRKLNERDDLADVVTLLQDLSKSRRVGEDYNLLARFFASKGDAVWKVGRACRSHGRPKFVLDAIDASLKIIEESDLTDPVGQLPWRLYLMGFFRLTFYGLEDEAIDLFERFLEKLAQKSEEYQGRWETHRREVVTKLAQLYLDAAVREAKTNAGAKVTNADKLKCLAVAVPVGYSEDFDGFDFYKQDYPAMLWGRWLREHESADQAAWRKCFRARLLEEMNCLDDDDPTNDQTGMETFSVSLLHAGDRRNAGAILAILFRSAEGENVDIKSRDPGAAQAHGEANAVDVSANASIPDPEPDAKPEPMAERERPIESSRPPGPPIVGVNSGTSSLASQEAADTAHEPGPDALSASQQLEESAKPDSNRLSAGGPEFQKMNGLENSTKGLRLYLDDPPHYLCDHCDRSTSEVNEMYFCEICYGPFNWCGECLARLRDPKEREAMNHHICNPDHAFYRAWPIPEEALYCAAESFEKGIVVKKAWLEGLRQEWWA